MVGDPLAGGTSKPNRWASGRATKGKMRRWRIRPRTYSDDPQLVIDIEAPVPTEIDAG